LRLAQLSHHSIVSGTAFKIIVIYLLNQPDILGMTKDTDIHIYSAENLLAQAEVAETYMGYKLLQFYVTDKGLLANEPTAALGTFYLSPSGGTLRDSELNIVLYSAKYDKFKGLGRL
jgi:hypothetical protein